MPIDRPAAERAIAALLRALGHPVSGDLAATPARVVEAYEQDLLVGEGVDLQALLRDNLAPLAGARAAATPTPAGAAGDTHARLHGLAGAPVQSAAPGDPEEGESSAAAEGRDGGRPSGVERPAAPGGPGLVIVRGLATATLCPHHLMPAVGHAAVAYLPGASVVGLGALARLVDACARRLTLQEAIGQSVVDALVRHAGARGARCELSLLHTCLAVRGARQPSALVHTIAIAGQDPGPLPAAPGPAPQGQAWVVSAASLEPSDDEASVAAGHGLG